MLKNIIVKDPVNTGRQLEIDMAKALAIVWMVLVHISERYYSEAVIAPGFETALNKFIEFAGGPLSAPVFMTAMGIGLAYSRNQNPAGTAKRGVILLLQAYLLNFLRITLPCLVLYCISRDGEVLQIAGMGMYVLDILHFAGLAFLFFALARLLNMRDAVLAALTLVFLIGGSLLEPLYPEPSVRASLPGFFTYQNQLTTFPFLLWLPYPVTGYLFGKLLQRVSDKKAFYGALLPACLVLFIAFTALLNAFGYSPQSIYLDKLYYKQDLIKFTWILLICFIWFAALYFVSLKIREGKLKSLIVYMSKKLNDIYMMQWILLGWIRLIFIRQIPVYGGGFLLLFVGILAASVLTVYLKDRLFPASRPAPAGKS